MAPDGVPAELALVGHDLLVDEAAAALGRAQGGLDGRDVLGVEGRAQLGVVAHDVLHRPERLDRVPVAIRGRVLEPAQERLVDRAADLLHDRPQLERRRQLGEVEHPVDLPVAIVDVDRVLEQGRRLGERHPVGAVQLALEEREVALHLGHEPVVPPVGEVLAVDRQDGVEIGAHRRGIGGVARHPGLVARAVLRALDVEVRIGRHGRRVDVAVDDLGQPVDREGRPETAEHVVAAEPPATDVEEHRADRMRDVQVVVDPEEVLLDVAVPGDRERLVAEEPAEDLRCACHGLALQGGALGAHRVWRVIDHRL